MDIGTPEIGSVWAPGLLVPYLIGARGWWLAHLYVLCKGGNHEVGWHSFSQQAIGAMLSEKRAQRESISVPRPIQNPDASCTSSHLYKERKGGPAPPGRGLSECEALCEPERTAWHVRSPLPM